MMEDHTYSRPNASDRRRKWKEQENKIIVTETFEKLRSKMKDHIYCENKVYFLSFLNRTLQISCVICFIY